MDCILVLTLATGGQLKYPLRFATLDAPPDDEITLEAVGLHKTSTIGFRLYSPTEYVIYYPRSRSLDQLRSRSFIDKNSSAISFQAYFTANSDRSLSITPEQGELLPASSNGTLLKISFCPTVYGRSYQGMLIVEVREGTVHVAEWSSQQ